MAVFYRYRSGVETFSVPVPAPSISVTDLKRLVLETSRHGKVRTRGRGPRETETVALSNADTGEEYTDMSALVPRGSTVVVRRVVAGPAAETIVDESIQVPTSAQKKGAFSSPSPTGAKDVEAKGTTMAIDAAEDPSLGVNCYSRRRGAVQNRTMPPPPPPHGYVCYCCREPGHFTEHCPINGDPRFDSVRATASTALPPAPVPACHDDGIPADLQCKTFKKVMADIVMSNCKCRFYSFCDRCIRDRLAGKSKGACALGPDPQREASRLDKRHALHELSDRRQHRRRGRVSDLDRQQHRRGDRVSEIDRHHTVAETASSSSIGSNTVAETASPSSAASRDRHIPFASKERLLWLPRRSSAARGRKKWTRAFEHGDGDENSRCEDGSFKRSCRCSRQPAGAQRWWF